MAEVNTRPGACTPASRTPPKTQVLIDSFALGFIVRTTPAEATAARSLSCALGGHKWWCLSRPIIGPYKHHHYNYEAVGGGGYFERTNSASYYHSVASKVV